jgi:hypothetical protein
MNILAAWSVIHRQTKCLCSLECDIKTIPKAVKFQEIFLKYNYRLSANYYSMLNSEQKYSYAQIYKNL